MNGFHIRCTEPGVAATLYIKADWADMADPDDVAKLLTEAYVAAMARMGKRVSA